MKRIARIGEAQKNLNKKFKKYYHLVLRVPHLPQNALGADTTASVFCRELHAYVITDAIRDESTEI
jgi:type I restriction enzyme R subunit